MKLPMLDPVNPQTPPPPSAPVDPRLGLAELKEKKTFPKPSRFMETFFQILALIFEVKM